jgi:hypothetical protein
MTRTDAQRVSSVPAKGSSDRLRDVEADIFHRGQGNVGQRRLRAASVSDPREHKHTDADFGEIRRQQREFGWAWLDTYIELHESPAARKKFRSTYRTSPYLDFYEELANQMNTWHGASSAGENRLRQWSLPWSQVSADAPCH